MKHAPVIWALLAGLAFAQQEPPNPSSGGVNEVRVAQAIDKGIAYLRTAPSPNYQNAYNNSDELILWTFIHAGVPVDDPKFKELFRSVTTQPMRRTYKVALLAMCLDEVDRAKYQDLIAQCAQFLVDTQCANGQWAYGNEVLAVKPVTVGEPAPRPTPSEGPKPAGKAPVFGGKPKAGALKKVTIAKTADGPETGDNSNSQYAALGLRACHDAGIVIPDATIDKAVKWWRDSQVAHSNPKDKDGKPAVASGKKPPMGWNYKNAAADERAPYHTMTAGAVGALVIYAYLQKKDWKKDATIQSGMGWLTDKFEIIAWNGYYMYALERVGILYGTETFGTRHWYREGANALLGTQKSDGSWSEDTPGENGSTWYGKTWDTCFAILFLRRATRPLVASGVR